MRSVEQVPIIDNNFIEEDQPKMKFGSLVKNSLYQQATEDQLPEIEDKIIASFKEQTDEVIKKILLKLWSLGQLMHLLNYV